MTQRRTHELSFHRRGRRVATLAGPAALAAAGLLLAACDAGTSEGPATAEAPAAPAAAPSASHDHAADQAVDRMTTAELAAAMEQGEVVVIDVRDFNSYVAGHIPGALQIPLNFVEGEIAYLPRDKPIVTYCS